MCESCANKENRKEKILSSIEIIAVCAFIAVVILYFFVVVKIAIPAISDLLRENGTYEYYWSKSGKKRLALFVDISIRVLVTIIFVLIALPVYIIREIREEQKKERNV